jgi:hypothetical protein
MKEQPFKLVWRKRTQWARFARTLERGSVHRLVGMHDGRSCEFVFSSVLMSRLRVMNDAMELPPENLSESLSLIARQARSEIAGYSLVQPGDDLVIEPVQAALQLKDITLRMHLLTIRTPRAVLIGLQTEAPIDETYWVDRLLNQVNLRNYLEEEGDGN